MPPEADSSPTPQKRIPLPPIGFGLLLALGPSIVWCAEYIGSGEVILATRTGAVLGVGVLWAIVVGVFLKYVIGLAGGWYTVATGESMIDLFGRLPGPRNAWVWLVLVAQFVASVFSIGSVSMAAGVFLHELLPVNAPVAGLGVALLACAVAWFGEFQPLKVLMAGLITLTLLGVAVIAVRVAPPLGELLAGLLPTLPEAPGWAREQEISENAWSEVLPLLGWGAGGFASQVWYTYWVMGAGYGAAGGRQGKPADEEALRELTEEDVERLGGWRRVVTIDATLAMLVGATVTCGFLIAGAGVLRPREIAPEGADVALTLATLFGAEWGAAGATMFLVGGAAALISTNLAQVTGWPYLLDDCVRLCLPGLASRWSPAARRRTWLVFFLTTTALIVFKQAGQPVALVRFSAVVEGLLLTPVQAAAMLYGLYWVMPRFFRPGVAERLRPSWWIGLGLAASFLVFSYFCLVQLPSALMK